MQLEFRSIDECSKPRDKWLELFNTYWPGYRTWLTTNGFEQNVSLQDSKAALLKYMPKMLPTYNRLCKLVGDDKLAHKFLTGFQPPAYVAACAQAVSYSDTAQLVRNYDYNPDLLEGAFMLTKWNKKRVMGINDCLIGLVDGVNDDGLAVSLTFGGRKEVGFGFGISFILRYVLEFCKTVDQAVKCLTFIPSHMSYNVIVVDKTGKHKTVMVAPDRKPIVTDNAYSTNHQQKVEWEENAKFNKTIERSNFLKEALDYDGLTNEQLASIFLMSPMYNTKFTEGFGTLYTAIYQPELGIAKLLWKDQKMDQSFDNFTEEKRLVFFQGYGEVAPIETAMPYAQPAAAQLNWQNAVADILAHSMAKHASQKSEEEIKSLRDRIIQGDDISWEVIADYWTNVSAPQEY